MKRYDLEMKGGSQVVETIIQNGRYKGRIISIIIGECYGKSALDFDFEIEDDVKSDCNLRSEDDGDMWSVILKDKDNNKLYVEGSSEEFNDMIVKNEIIGQFKTGDEAIAFVDSLEFYRKNMEDSIMNEKTNMKEFEKAARPAMEWLQKNGNPHQKIIIEMDGVGLVVGEMFIPENAMEAASESED